MKRWLTGVLAICFAVFAALPVSAENTSKIPGTFVKYETNGGYLVFKKMDDAGSGCKEAWLMGTGDQDWSHRLSGDVVIPAEIDGYPVTRLYLDELDSYVEEFDSGEITQDPHAAGGVFRTDGFTRCSEVTSITFPGTIKNFEKMWDGDLYAFEGCTKLKSVVFEEGVEELNGGFSGVRLENVTLPSSIRFLGEDEFQRALPTLRITAPSGTYAGNYAASHTAVYDSPFEDLPGHWAEQEIAWSYQQGWIRGTSETAFSPNAPATRGMFVTLLYRWAAPEEEAGTNAGFRDVEETAYYAEAVSWAAKHGYAEGTGDGRFFPNQPVSRQQMAAMIYRYVCDMEQKQDWTPHLTALEGFSDLDRVSGYAKPGIQYLLGQGVLNGKRGGRLDPKGAATRAEMTALFFRLKKPED